MVVCVWDEDGSFLIASSFANLRFIHGFSYIISDNENEKAAEFLKKGMNKQKESLWLFFWIQREVI